MSDTVHCTVGYSWYVAIKVAIFQLCPDVDSHSHTQLEIGPETQKCIHDIVCILIYTRIKI